MPKISIIVPVYKAEKYICRCLDSIVSQTFTDWECLLIDDGSPDNSGKICDDYAEKDNRFRVFHKMNGGVASARQLGFEKSLGDYVIHADPDDWVEDDMLESLYSNACENDSDMVICDYYHNSITQKYIIQQPTALDSFSILKDILNLKLIGTCWNKLVRRDFVCDMLIAFPSNMVVMEDQFFVTCVLIGNPNISYLNKAYYHYDTLINCNSLVNNLNINKLYSIEYYIDYFTKATNNQSLFSPCKVLAKQLAFTANFKTGDKFKNYYNEINSLLCDYKLLLGNLYPFVRMANKGVVFYYISHYFYRVYFFIKSLIISIIRYYISK